MIGYIRTIVKNHEVIEGKLDTPVEDLRITKPFSGLQKFVDLHDFEKMDFKTHCHTPYIVILIKFLEKFKKKYNKEYPQSNEEQAEYLKWIKEETENAIERRNKENENKVIDESDEFAKQINTSKTEENFQDALKKKYFKLGVHMKLNLKFNQF